MTQDRRFSREQLHEFCMKIFAKLGCDEVRSSIITDVCLEADMRGIPSHGVARLARYISYMENGTIVLDAEPELLFKTGVSAVYDGHHGVGQYISKIVSEKAVEMAQKNGVGIAVVRNSNHYGIAGYWAEQIMKNEMIGISSSNTAPLVVPTFGREAILGSNPIAISFPSYFQTPIMLDMATSVIPRGKLEVYERRNHPIPHGWAVDSQGKPTDDPACVLENLKNKAGGGILPLGGESTTFGGHKGFGLALIVELLTAGLSLGEASSDTYNKNGCISHFFMAIRLDLFGDNHAILDHVNQITTEIKKSEPSKGHSEVFIHNELEYKKRAESLLYGIQLDLSTYQQLLQIGEKFTVSLD
jgi:LDH2 family malate/lactate/ureidoglycolate dehydrogenase